MLGELPLNLRMRAPVHKMRSNNSALNVIPLNIRAFIHAMHTFLYNESHAVLRPKESRSMLMKLSYI